MKENNNFNPFKEIEDLLKETHIETEQYKQKIFDTVKYRIEADELQTDEDDIYMKKNNFKHAKIAILAAIIAVGSTSLIYGSEILSSIIKQLHIGNTEITQYSETPSITSDSDNVLSLEAMQKGFQGKLFDKDGNAVLYGEAQEYYTQDGQFITSMFVDETENGEYEFCISTDTSEIQPSIQTFHDIKKIANETIKFPTYIPEGYQFKEATSECDGNNINTTYENMYGDNIVILSSTSEGNHTGVAIIDSDPLQEIKIKDVTVVLSINAAFWEYDEVSYQLYWNHQDDTSMDVEEVSKIIESMILS